MPTREYICDLNAPIEQVWKFYDTIDTLFTLTPPEMQARLEGERVPMRPGVVYPLIFKRFGVSLRWDAEIVEYEPPIKFVDRQVTGRGPFKAWEHRHLFAALPDNRTRLTDHVTYTLPLGPLSSLADALFVHRDMDRMFAYRHKITRECVEKKEEHRAVST